jgi:hypothetical protein
MKIYAYDNRSAHIIMCSSVESEGGGREREMQRLEKKWEREGYKRSDAGGRHGVCAALLPKAPHIPPAKHPPTTKLPHAPAYITCQWSAEFSHGPSPTAVGTATLPFRGGTGTGRNSHMAGEA